MKQNIVHRLQTAHDRFLEIGRMPELLLEAKNEIELWRDNSDYWQARYWRLFDRVKAEIKEVTDELQP